MDNSNDDTLNFTQVIELFTLKLEDTAVGNLG